MIKNKQAKMSGLLVLVIVAVGAYLLVPGVKDWVSGLGGAPSTPETGPEKPCYIEDTTLTVGPAEEMYNPSTKVTTAYHRLFKNDVDKGLYADGSTVTVNPSDKISIIWSENTTQTSSSEGYYASKQSFTVPCAGEVTAGEQKDTNAYKLYAGDANNMTRRFFNENNGNLNSVTDNQTLNAGDQKTMQWTLEGTYEDAYSPYGPIVLVVEANDTTYLKFDVQFQGVTCTPGAPVPGSFKVTSVDNKAWAFSCAKDGAGIRSNTKWDGSLAIQVETGVNPVATGGDVITVSYFDSDYYLNSDTGVEEVGVNNNDNADVGEQTFTDTIYVT